MKDVAWKKPKGWLESSGCEIQRWIEKGFVGFDCFGFKKQIGCYCLFFGNKSFINLSQISFLSCPIPPNRGSSGSASTMLCRV